MVRIKSILVFIIISGIFASNNTSSNPHDFEVNILFSVVAEPNTNSVISFVYVTINDENLLE